MDVFKKRLAAIGTGLAPLIPAYWKSMEYINDKLNEIEASGQFQLIKQTYENSTQHINPETMNHFITNLEKGLSIAILTYVTSKIAEPIIKKVAKIYKVELE